MYNEYIKEREGFETLVTDQGFAIYRFGGTECYIKDIYVKPEFRKSKCASQMADLIVLEALEKGCEVLVGSVSLGANEATTSIRVLIGYGMKVIAFKDNLLWFVKKLKGE